MNGQIDNSITKKRTSLRCLRMMLKYNCINIIVLYIALNKTATKVTKIMTFISIKKKKFYLSNRMMKIFPIIVSILAGKTFLIYFVF